MGSERRSCPGCGVDLTGTHGKRRWCSESCRKQTLYAGTCESCGASTDGSNGKAQAPTHCQDCAPAANRTWPAERIIEAIRAWAERYGQPPSALDWNPALAANQGALAIDEIRKRYGDGDWPASSTVLNRFPSWNEAIIAAGLVPRRIGVRKVKPPTATTEGER